MDITLIYGIRNVTEASRAAIAGALNKQGHTVRQEYVRSSKAGILNQMEAFAKGGGENAALLLSTHLESDRPYEVEELVGIMRLAPEIKIILIFSANEEKSFLRSLINEGMYLGVYEEDTSASRIADLIISGRTVLDAKEYYGLEDKKEYGHILTVNESMGFILSQENGDDYCAKAAYVQEHLPSEKAFEDVLRRMPDDVKAVLAEQERFAPYLAEYIELTTAVKTEKPKVRAGQEEGAVFSSQTVRDIVTRAIQRNLIGVAGVQGHIGCTHQSILIANYLSGKGFRVAAVEIAPQDNSSFQKISESNGLVIKDGQFSYKNVDYYPDMAFGSLPQLNRKEYNFIVCDFGRYTKEMSGDFDRCVLQVIVSGSQPWEMKNIYHVFGCCGTEEEREKLYRFHYLFMSTPAHAKVPVRKAMQPFSKVLFGDYQPNPFSQEGYAAISQLLEAFVIDEPERKGFFRKISRLFD